MKDYSQPFVCALEGSIVRTLPEALGCYMAHTALKDQHRQSYSDRIFQSMDLADQIETRLILADAQRAIRADKLAQALAR